MMFSVGEPTDWPVRAKHTSLHPEHGQTVRYVGPEHGLAGCSSFHRIIEACLSVRGDCQDLESTFVFYWGLLILKDPSLPEGVRGERFLVMVRVHLGDEAAELAEDVGILSGPGHVVLPAGQASLLPGTQVRLGDVINHQPQRGELGR